MTTFFTVRWPMTVSLASSTILGIISSRLGLMGSMHIEIKIEISTDVLFRAVSLGIDIYPTSSVFRLIVFPAIRIFPSLGPK